MNIKNHEKKTKLVDAIRHFTKDPVCGTIINEAVSKTKRKSPGPPVVTAHDSRQQVKIKPLIDRISTPMDREYDIGQSTTTKGSKNKEMMFLFVRPFLTGMLSVPIPNGTISVAVEHCVK